MSSRCSAQAAYRILGHQNLSDIFLATIKASLVIKDPPAVLFEKLSSCQQLGQVPWTSVAKNRLQKAK